jgi:hypothetical protein
VDGKLLKWEDLQGFWDMIKIQVDNVEELFTELELIRQNGWKELCMHVSSEQYKITGGAVDSCVYNYLCNQCLSPLKSKYFVFLNM